MTVLDAIKLVSLQLDKIKLLRYLPSKRREVKEFRNVAKRVNKTVTEEIQKRKQSMQNGEDPSDFIGVYLSEVEKSKGVLDDRLAI